MRVTSWVLFIGTVGIINIYEDIMTDEESGKLDAADVKKLQKKFGVKEKRSAVQSAAHELSVHFEDFHEKIIESLKRPLARGLVGCSEVSEEGCNCMRLVCFGESVCTKNISLASQTLNKAKQDHDSSSDHQKAILAHQRLRHSSQFAGSPNERFIRRKTKQHSRLHNHKHFPKFEGENHLKKFLRCRQTTMNALVLCECKMYTRIH